MSFSIMFDILKKKEKGKIVLVSCGAFYIAIGEDAVFLNKKIELKCTCFKNNMCKVGIPKDAIEKYLEKLKKLRYSYVVYDYIKLDKKLVKKYFFEGKKHKIDEINLNCLKCKGISKYAEGRYLEAVTKLLEKENIDYSEKYNEVNMFEGYDYE